MGTTTSSSHPLMTTSGGESRISHRVGAPPPECGSKTNYYRPPRSCGKVMFLHLSVMLFTGMSATHTPPLADPPPHLDRHPLGRYPSPRQAPPLGKHPWANTPLGRHPLCSACWDTVNKRAVRILLECNLAREEFCRKFKCIKMKEIGPRGGTRPWRPLGSTNNLRRN